MSKVHVLVGGTDRYHDVLGAGLSLRDTLVKHAIPAALHIGFERFGDDYETDVDVYVVYAMWPRMTDAAQEALAARVAGGAGLVVLHASIVVVHDDQDQWLTLVGSRFERHDPFMRMQVRIDVKHPVTEGIDDFEIDDEPYEVSWTGSPGTVLASFELNGTMHPLVYTLEHGRGRICYIALGHDARCWGHPMFARLLTQSTRWVGGDDAGN